jgi:UDPglucose--hexose-1-phosphate uridylyltransferase
LDNPAYNLLFHTGPFASPNGQKGYFELFPRLTLAAGFELGTDIWVNPVAPEAAARRLRSED